MRPERSRVETVARSWLAALLLIVCPALPAADAPADRPAGWRLAAESSPYLQLHADNPVEWYPWGEAALARARRENKPLFISIGYFTCHWCHVMARESFSSPEIAALLNTHFVSIKIDREQRPDLDAAYLQYVTLTRGQAGWPLSVWATPDGAPFFGGTYFPPVAQKGRAGMRQLLTRVAAAWTEDEAGVRKTAGQAIAALRRASGSVEPLKELDAHPLQQARSQYAAVYDELQGGFGPAPKFPQPARLLFLLQEGDGASVDMALNTLERMAAGGIHDQLGGGFHRYATDFEWRVPHFEKMLYDQALIARAYLFAWRATRDESYATIARTSLDFALESLRNGQGGFYAALGADSPIPGAASGRMEEGAYYTWRWTELADVLGDELRDWAVLRYGVSPQGEAQGEVAGSNVLHRELDTAGLAEHFGVDLITAGQRNARLDELLLAARSRRPAVPVDDKVVAVWNGYMITTLALAGRLLDEPRYIEAAAATAGFVLDKLHDAESGVLFRDWRAGVRGVPGFCDDYAAIAEGLLALYRVTANRDWLARARVLTDSLVERFWDAAHGGFYSTPADTELWLREKEAVDGATLAPNGIAIHVLQQLATITGNPRYLELAWQTAAWAGAQLRDTPSAMPYTLIVWPELPATRPVDKQPAIHGSD
jgi:uncharacterized protein YyaL (SSP411 family)